MPVSAGVGNGEVPPRGPLEGTARGRDASAGQAGSFGRIILLFCLIFLLQLKFYPLPTSQPVGHQPNPPRNLRMGQGRAVGVRGGPPQRHSDAQHHDNERARRQDLGPAQLWGEEGRRF